MSAGPVDGTGPGPDTAHPYCTDVQETPPAVSDIDQLVRASRLYYELGETQSRVAEILGVTRPQVSRLLKRARAEGIVEIRIHDGAAVQAGAVEALRERFGLAAVHVAPDLIGSEEVRRRMIGRLGAE